MSIKHSRVSHITALGKRLDDCLKVLATVDMEQGRHVLNDQPRGLKRSDTRHDLEEESAAVVRKTSVRLIAANRSHVADSLAGEAEADARDPREIKGPPIVEVFETLRARKSIGKDSPVDIIEFDLPGRAPSRAFKPEVKPANAGADASVGEFIHKRRLD